jgi:threonine aldolase
MARDLHRAVAGLDDVVGLSVGPPPAVNSIFPILPPSLIGPLRDWCFFWDWDVPRHQVRWMTSWDTSPADIATFAAGVTELAKALASKN